MSSSSTPPDDGLPPSRGFAPREDQPFAPRVNWRFWAPILAVLVAFPLLWWKRRHDEAARRRERLLREHAALTATLAPSYRALRSDIERWIVEAAGPYPGDLRDPSLSWSTLTTERALYGRIRAGEVQDVATGLRALRHRYPDQLTHCLGIEVLFAREALDKGAFLLPSYVDAVRGTDDTDRLHALREDLLFRLRRDTELLVDAGRRPYFVLAIDEARVSVEGPTRVYVYDLRARRPVLRARGRGDDLVLIPFQISGVPRPARPARLPPPGLSQHDCSVANAVRTVAGVATLGMQHAPSPQGPDAQAPVDATADVPTDAPSHE